METKFTERQIAACRRIAANVYPDITKIEKLNAKIADLQKEAADIQRLIDTQEAYIKELTGGYTASDLFVKEYVVSDKVDANGRPQKRAVYNLRYPETFVPVKADTEPANTETTEESITPSVESQCETNENTNYGQTC